MGLTRKRSEQSSSVMIFVITIVQFRFSMANKKTNPIVTVKTEKCNVSKLKIFLSNRMGRISNKDFDPFLIDEFISKEVLAQNHQ